MFLITLPLIQAITNCLIGAERAWRSTNSTYRKRKGSRLDGIGNSKEVADKL